MGQESALRTRLSPALSRTRTRTTGRQEAATVRRVASLHGIPQQTQTDPVRRAELAQELI